MSSPAPADAAASISVVPPSTSTHPASPIHDEFHPDPLASPSSAQSARQAGDLEDVQLPPTGAFFPSAPGMASLNPAAHLLSPAENEPPSRASTDVQRAVAQELEKEKAEAAAIGAGSAAAAAAEKEKPSRKPSHNTSSISSSDDTAVGEKKQSRLPWKKAKKGKDEDAKKAKQKEEEANALPPVSLFDLFRFATRFEVMLDMVGLLLAVAAGATQPLMTLIFGRLTTSFTDYGRLTSIIGSSTLTPEQAAELEAAKSGLKTDSWHNALYLVAIGVGMFLCSWAFMFIWNYTGEVNSKRVRERYLQAVLRQEVAYFDDLGAGEVATRIETDCHLVQEGTSEKVALCAQFLGTFFTGFILAYVKNWRLALAMSSIFPCIMLFGSIMFVTLTKMNTRALNHFAAGGTIAEEVVSSIRTVKAFGTNLLLGQKFDAEIEVARKIGVASTPVEGGALASMFFVVYSAYALAFFYGGILVAQGHADSGTVVTVFMSILIGSFSLAMLTPELQHVTKARAAAAKLFATIDRVPSIDSADPGGEKPESVKGIITFEDVQFHYPSRPNIPILKGLTTTFEAGNTVALVGASGSGKSTVVALVERFYDPVAGTVKLDGRDIKSLNVKWMRQQIGFVQQEPVLFATTVRGNVEHGLIGSQWENASDAEKFKLVQQACIDANAHDFITRLPNGYDTIVGERGMLLSGGQKQRVAIARAIVSDPRILLLDEATSALDTQSEGIVQDALDKASRGRTTITIAHRLSTVRDADKILVMGGGQILEEGTHNSLLANPDGPYAQLVSAQNLSQQGVARPEVDEDVAVPGHESPTEEKGGFAGLMRAATGRSLASAAMDDLKTRRDAEAADEDNVSAFQVYKRLLQINKSDKYVYVLGAIGSLCAGMVYPALSILFGTALQDFQYTDTEQIKSSLRNKALYYFITAILAALAITVQGSMMSRAGWNLTGKLRKMAFHALLRHDVEWFDEEKNSTGAITANLSGDPQKVQGLFGPTLGTIIQCIATLIGGCIIGLAYGPLLALIGIAMIPLTVSQGFIRLKVVVLKERRTKKIHAAGAQMASEAASAVRTVAALTREQDVDRMYSEALKEPLRISVRSSFSSQALYGASQGMSFIVIAIVFYVGCLWLIDGRYNTKEFFTVLTSVIFASIQAGNVFNFVPDASKASSAGAAVLRLIDYQPEVDAEATDGIMLDRANVSGHIKLEGIHFRYPSRPGVRVLRDLDVDCPAGKFVALVGPSGCGKSTTIQMLERFYDPLVGQVTLDGIDIREINVASYRSQIALVSQEPTLYAGSVRFNILLGANKPMGQVTEDEIVKACKDANIYDFIMSLPDGFDTEVGGKGSQLSGGQKQRIAIARALIRDPKILLLDEATSALDSQSEKVVQHALDQAAKGRTTIAIAHRLSTIQRADIIYCFGEGKVVEKGTHAELISKRGPYFELVQMQNLSKQ